jgi:threonine/homoserine/homoserine lactone efflux protein
MNLHTALAFSSIAGLAIISPGPAILLALRNGVNFGLRSVLWSSLGNICGIFCLSAAAMLGLGLLLMSSALLFGMVKLLGALYLFYIGIRHVFGHATALGTALDDTGPQGTPRPWQLYREAVLVAATNPKAILFFTALFPQFISADQPLLGQFLLLTGIFMALSFCSLISYAFIASRARGVLREARYARWVNRLVGSVFIAFGALLLAMRRPLS